MYEYVKYFISYQLYISTIKNLNYLIVDKKERKGHPKE